jgi:hypothetical protein
MNIRIPGLEGIDIDKVLGRAPKRKAVDRKIKLSPKQKKKITAKPRRISTPMGEINIPGIGLAIPRPRPKPKPPVNKVRPKPRPPLNKARPKPKPSGSVPNEVELSKALKDFSKQIKSRPSSKRPPVLGSIPGTGEIGIINIPGVGPINIPRIDYEDTPPVPTDYKEKINFEGSMDGTTDRDISAMTWEEIDEEMNDIRFASRTGGGYPDRYQQLKDQYESIAPISRLEKDYDLAGYNRYKAGDNVGEGYLEEGERLKKLIESRQSGSGDQPVDTQPVETQPVETQPIQAPPPPDPFKDYVPRNILGTSFDPKDVSAQQKMVADARARQTPGANIQGGGYLTYDNPLLGNKQTQFGGYGQPMPTAPLMNYAGLASPTTYSKPPPDPDKEIIR